MTVQSLLTDWNAITNWLITNPTFTKVTIKVDNHPKTRTDGSTPTATLTLSTLPKGSLTIPLIAELTHHLHSGLKYKRVVHLPPDSKGTYTFLLYANSPIQEVPK